MEDTTFWVMVFAIIVVLGFDYTNGFHDASNIIGTIIASRAMTPIQSVIVVAVFELLGPILGGTAVANTIGKAVTISDLSAFKSIMVVTSGIWGAIFWNLLTWWFGLPSSSSHALVGGLVGAVIFAAGADHVKWGMEALIQKQKLDGFIKIVVSLLVSPLAGFWCGFILYRILRGMLIKAKPSANKTLRKLQYISAAGLAFSHGSNDAQKSMGIITLLLILGGVQTGAAAKAFVVPGWVIYSCAGFITLGILSGGWRIVRTVGFGIFKVRPLHALSVQLTSGSLIMAAAFGGFPVSTTHVSSSAIMGVGSAERPRAVRWAKAKEIVSTWFITIPGSGLVGGFTYWISSLLIKGL